MATATWRNLFAGLLAILASVSGIAAYDLHLARGTVLTPEFASATMTRALDDDASRWALASEVADRWIEENPQDWALIAPLLPDARATLTESINRSLDGPKLRRQIEETIREFGTRSDELAEEMVSIDLGTAMDDFAEQLPARVRDRLTEVSSDLTTTIDLTQVSSARLRTSAGSRTAAILAVLLSLSACAAASRRSVVPVAMAIPATLLSFAQATMFTSQLDATNFGGQSAIDVALVASAKLTLEEIVEPRLDRVALTAAVMLFAACILALASRRKATTPIIDDVVELDEHRFDWGKDERPRAA